MFLLDLFVKNGFCPEVIRNGRKINLLSLPELGLRLISSGFYIPGNEYEMSNMFRLNYNPVFLPYKILQFENIRYHGDLPSYELFIDEFDSLQTRVLKANFYKDFAVFNTCWHFDKELLTECDQKVFLLASTIIKFINESFEFQTLLQSSKGITMKYLFPFSQNICTIGGFTYLLFRIFCLNEFDIFIVKNEYGFPQRKVSQVEYDWASYLCYKFPEKNFQSAFNNEGGQKYFKECIPDLYSSNSGLAMFLNECFIHCHYEQCKLFPKSTATTLTPWGKTYLDVNTEFWTKTTNLIANNPEVKEVKVEWECHFKELVQKSLDYQLFLKTNYKIHPLERLTSRSCFRGAYFEVFAHVWSKIKFPTENLYFLDINGLYSYCALKFPFMTGKYNIILGDQINNIEICEKKLFYFKKKITGACLITILPPRKLKYPFLLYKNRAGQSVLTLCAACSHTHSKKCNHTELERALTGNYLITEIEYALSLNYKILEIHECHAYESSDFVFKHFVEALNYMKTKNLSDPGKISTELCERLNADHSNINFHFQKSDFRHNPTKKQFYKMMANSLFGKIAQKNNKSKILYVSSQSELEKLYFSGNVVEDVFCLNDYICQVFLKPNEKRLPANRNSNCYIGAQMTSFARQVLYEHMQKIFCDDENTIYYVDCDSIVFASPSSKEIPLPISIKCGDFKHEYLNATSFYALGPKSYCFNSFDFPLCRIKGLSIKNNPAFNEELFEQFVTAMVLQKPLSLKVCQVRYRANFKCMTILKRIENIAFNNFTTLKRRLIVPNSERLLTIPFGYSV